jgi:hypothetical protein
MKKLLVVVLLAGIYSLAYAHGVYQAKAFTFTGGPPGSHKVDVIIDQHNTLEVLIDDRSLGTRNNFCTSIQRD